MTEAKVGGSGTVGATVKMGHEVPGNWDCMVGEIAFESEHTAPDNPHDQEYLSVFV